MQGLVNAKKTGATIIATSGSGGNIFRTTGGQQVSIIRSAGSNPSNLNPGSGGIATIVNKPTKAFVCDFKGCNKSFEKASFLKRHAKLHSSNCKFVCDVCTKCFESQSKLDDHYRKHTGAKPFICHICGNAFRYKGMFHNVSYLFGIFHSQMYFFFSRWQNQTFEKHSWSA